MNGDKGDPRGSAHILVERVSGTIEAEDQGAVPLTVGVGDPFARVPVGRSASEARVYGGVEGAFLGGDGGGTEQREGGHVGERGQGQRRRERERGL
jgi:hypothetical protein